MARLGEQIGRGINLAAKFAVGAGAFDQVGAPKGITQTGLSLLNPGQGAGVNPTVGDRFRGGLSAISPTFRQAEFVRGINQSRGITDQVNQAQLTEIRAGQKPMFLDDIFGQLGPEARKVSEQRLRENGLLQTDPETGKLFLTTSDAKTRLGELNNEPREQIEINTAMMQDTNNNITRVTAQKERVIEDMVIKEMKREGLDPKSATLLPGVKKRIRAEIERGERGDLSATQGFDQELQILQTELSQEETRQQDLQEEIDLSTADARLKEAKIEEAKQTSSEILTPTKQKGLLIDELMRPKSEGGEGMSRAEAIQFASSLTLSETERLMLNFGIIPNRANLKPSALKESDKIDIGGDSTGFNITDEEIKELEKKSK